MMGITQKLVEVGKKVSYLQKGGKNESQSYTYARAQDVFLKVNEVMHEQGVACVRSECEILEVKDGLGKNGNTCRMSVRIAQTYRDAETGEEAYFQGQGSGADSGDKALMKANTAALKYLLTDAFNISWGDDPEASDPETGEATGKRQEKPAKAPKKPSSAAEHKKLLKAISEATTTAQLDECRASVLKLDNSTPEYAEAKQAVIDRRAQLDKQTTIPGT